MLEQKKDEMLQDVVGDGERRVFEH